VLQFEEISQIHQQKNDNPGNGNTSPTVFRFFSPIFRFWLILRPFKPLFSGIENHGPTNSITLKRMV